MKIALIGHTGFIGSNLIHQNRFDKTFNSKNIEEIVGQEFDVVVCAGAPAKKWDIDRDTGSDEASLQILKEALSKASIKKLILISTVYVYKNTNGANEDTQIETEGLHPYGLRRYELEQFCKEHFDTLIVRLPGLFGEGLKRSIIFDLLTGNRDHLRRQANSDSEYQYYYLANLWRDIQTALGAGLNLVNFATEPISNEEIARNVFGELFVNHPEGKDKIRYDFKSKNDQLYGGKHGYLYSKQQVLDELKDFVALWRSQQ